MVSGQNRGIGHPDAIWQAPLLASITIAPVATDGDEAFYLVKSMIMRRADNTALVVMEDAGRIEATRLADW